MEFFGEMYFEYWFGGRKGGGLIVMYFLSFRIVGEVYRVGIWGKVKKYFFYRGVLYIK